MTTKKLLRVEKAKERRLEYSKLTTKEKLEGLDKLLGVGIGAVRQRSKLSFKLESELTNKILSSLNEENSTSNSNSNIKKKNNYQKPKKS